MKKLGFFIFFLLGFLALSAQTADQLYIETYKDLAIQKMNQHGVPASVILAIAMHESASGTSKIARHLNNHFGIKGKNKSKILRSAYKGYDSVAHSYADFIRLLEEKPVFNKYFKLYTAYDYKNWVRGIQRGGYAHSKTWGSQVIAFIRKYQLEQYDNRPSVLTDSTQIAVEAAEEPGFVLPGIRIYKVKKGDTLSGIAKRLGTSVKVLMNKNYLKSTNIRPGQKLNY